MYLYAGYSNFKTNKTVDKLFKNLVMRLILLFSINFLLSAIGICQNTWVYKSPLPNGQGREKDIGFSVGATGFVGLGFDNDLWCYNTATDTWVQKTSFPGIFRSNGFGFSIGHSIYFGGGSGHNDFWQYNTVSNSWNQLDTLPIAINFGKGFSTYNKGYVISSNQVYEYDPVNDIWTQKSNFPGVARRFAIAITIMNKGYFGLGNDGITYGSIKDLWEYDPLLDSWIQKSDCPIPRQMGFGFCINTKGYFGGGIREWYGSDLTDFYEYDPLTDVWTSKNASGVCSYGSASFSTGNGLGYYGFGNITCHIGSCSPFNFLRAYAPDNTSTYINNYNSDSLLFSIYPNPTLGEFQFKTNGEPESLKIIVYNIEGKIVYSETSNNTQTELRKDISLSKFGKGVYAVEITVGDRRQVRKVVVN